MIDKYEYGRLTIAQAAQIANMSEYKIRKAIKDDKLMASRIGKRLYTSKERLDKFLQEQGNHSEEM